MPDALAYTPSDTGRRSARAADADLVAVIRRAIARKKRERGEEDDSTGTDGLDAGVDLYTPARDTSSAGPVDLGGIVPLGATPTGRDSSSRALGGVATRPVPLGATSVDLAAAIAPGGDADGPSVGIGAGTPAALDTTSGINPTIAAAGRGPFGLSISPFGLTLSANSPFGGVGINASPISGVSLTGRSPNAPVNLALGLVGRAAGIPTSAVIAQGLAPALAAALGPFGLGIAGFNTMIEIAEAVAKTANVQTVLATLQDHAALRAMVNNPNLTADARANIEMALAANQQALREGVTAAAQSAQGIPSVISQTAASLAGVNGFAMKDGNIAVPAQNPSGLPGGAFTNAQGVTISGYSGLPAATAPRGNFGRGASGDDPDPTTGLVDTDPMGEVGGGAAPSGGGVGGGGSGPSGTGEGSSTGSDGGGQSPYLATWAMDGLGIGPGERKERGWAAFHASFMKRFPLTGESQFRRYARLARQVVEALEKRPHPEQMQARQMIYRRIVAPLGEKLELHEVDEAWTAMRAVALDLARRLGLRVDPADVPRPLHEVAARAQQKRQEKLRATRERVVAAEAEAVEAEDRVA